MVDNPSSANFYVKLNIKELKTKTWLAYLFERCGVTGVHQLEKELFHDGKSFEIEDANSTRKRIFDGYQYNNINPSENTLLNVERRKKGKGSIDVFNRPLWSLLDDKQGDVEFLKRTLLDGSKQLYRYYCTADYHSVIYIRPLDALVQKASIESLEAILSLILLLKIKSQTNASLLTDLCYSAIVLLAAIPQRHRYFLATIGEIRQVTVENVLQGINISFDVTKVNFPLLDEIHTRLYERSNEIYSALGQKFKQTNYHYYLQIFVAVEFKRFDWFLIPTNELPDIDNLFDSALRTMTFCLQHIDKRKHYRQQHPMQRYFEGLEFKAFLIDDFFSGDNIFELLWLEENR